MSSPEVDAFNRAIARRAEAGLRIRVSASGRDYRAGLFLTGLAIGLALPTIIVAVVLIVRAT